MKFIKGFSWNLINMNLMWNLDEIDYKFQKLWRDLKMGDVIAMNYKGSIQETFDEVSQGDPDSVIIVCFKEDEDGGRHYSCSSSKITDTTVVLGALERMTYLVNKAADDDGHHES